MTHDKSPTTEEAGLREVLGSPDLQVECGQGFVDGWTFSRITEALRRLSQRESDGAAPIDMILYCPRCHLQHVDGEEPGRPTFDGREIGETEPWLNPPHRSHLCHGCGFIWRPADVPTNGVEAIKTKGKADNEPAPPHPDSAREGALEEAAQMADEQADFWREQKKQLRPESDVPDAHERFSNYIENATAISRSIRALRSPAPQGEVRNR